MISAGSEIFAKYRLAEILGKTLAEIDQMPVDEFNGWIVYFNAKEKARPR